MTIHFYDTRDTDDALPPQEELQRVGGWLRTPEGPVPSSTRALARTAASC